MKQTDTPEFKRWFGDSKVVDASGNPMVVYHGTSKDKPFSSFTRNAQGTWFTSDPEAASSYATTNDSQKVVYEDGRYVSKNTSAQVFPVYLSIKNPLKVEGEVLKKWQASVNYRAANKMLVGDAKYRGYDGLMFGEGVFVAFEPTQIKSAIGNKGTFDPKDSNITNPRQLMGININDKCQDFTGQILRGEKTIETRKTRSLDPYIGERVGLVRTGVDKATLVGYATVGEPVVYDSVAKFRRDYDKHLVAPGSAFDMKDHLKYGYPLMQVESITPKLVQSKGIVARKLNPMQSKPFWEMTEQEYIQATGMPKQVLPYSPGYAAYEKWKETNLSYFEMVEKAARAGKRIPDAIVASLPAGVRARVKSDLPKTEKQFNREYVIHGSKSCLDFIEPRIGDFTRDSYSGSGEGTFEEMGGKEYAYFRNPEDIDLVLQYAGDSGCVMVSSLPGDALFVKQDGLYNEYDELVSQDVGTGPEDGDIISEQGAGVLFQIPVEQWKRSGEKSIYSYLKKKMRGTITNPTKRNAIRNKLSRIIESDDRILCYDTAADEDFYRLWDIIHTDLTLNKESLREIEGMLDDDGVLVIESGESPAGLQDHFRKTTRYQGLLLVQGPLNPEQARIETEKLRRDLE